MASGVQVPDNLVDTVKNMKLKKLDKPYTWLTIVFKPTIQNPTQLEVADKGTGDYQSFKTHLSGVTEGCYAVVDVPLVSGGTKLVLITWARDDLAPKPKMMVASTLGALKGKIEGVDHYQASDVGDLDLKAVQAKVDRKH
eukprot:CAMPEP_0113847094 /NCGR_PEP_ID=MMETSP0372-20130328/1674_1 /TAXON_ID=340204 /ORGANISM="Lankesteria abbotti" /LENGTH=139 /DNA_ID=CAMNT_0000816315 /DNA_START=137 /DNA_END=556 /DNA_ORIENTATION=+ /assembly_acc=CAM_ASM_000359